MSLKVDHGLSERLASLEANLVNLEEMLSRIQYLQRIEQSRVMNMHQFGRYESELSTAKSLLEQLAEETVAVNADIFDRHLAYEGSSDKFHSIIDVDDEILEWVLGLPGPGEASSVGLSNWLSWGKGVYRITGKAGSGKSTLMKFIVGHPRTEDRLDIYSSPKKVTIVSHFFARPGAPLQHSLEGLLRYLLVTVIEQHPAYGPLVLPVIQPRNDDLESSQRYVSQLESSLVGLVQEMRDLASFCFFIDGLDECDETDHEGVYRLLSELTKHQNCKVCVSSRPIPGMMDDVSGNHHLRLADRALVSNDEPPAGHLGSSDKPFGTDMEWTTMPTNAGSIFGLPKDSGLEIAESPLTGATIQIVLDELVHLFFSNLELNQLLVAATEDANIGGPRLQRNFQRLLVEFSKELRSVARDPTYKEVATVVGNFSPFLAGQIIRHVNETGPLTKHQISSSKDDTKSSKKSSTDESIASESCDDTDPDGVSMPPISHLNLHYEAPQEEPDPPSEYDGNPRASGKQQTEEKIAVTSEQAKDFLRAGTPLEKLKASLREFVTRKALDTTQDDVDSNSEGNSDDDDGFVLV
ncbi:hypothetical protein GGR52DRAFT_576667 [Hypoxylon sp. FL1284]|nr:hypothetical protein GGR52DRAFT_576667 [Hypoxylon sp. FL1284]